MCNITLASFAPVTPPSVPLGASTWSLYLDFTGLSDAVVLSSIQTPLIGPGVTPVNSPAIDGVGIGGRSALFIDQATSQALACDSLASLQAGSDKAVTVIARVKRDWPLSSRSVFGWGHSGQSTNDYFYGAFPGGAANSPTLARDAVDEATKTITGSGPVDYADHVVAFRFNGTTGWVYVDGVEVATGDLDTADLTVNKFAIGARVTTAITEHLGGWISHFAVAASALSPEQIQAVGAAWTADDLGTPGKTGGAPFQFFGDSITRGDSDTYATSSARGGFRYDAYEHWRANRLAINAVGHLTQGIFADPECSAQGGADTTFIRGLINTHIPTYEPVGIFVMSGTNDADAIESGSLLLSTWSANYAGMLQDARDKLDALGSGRQIIVANLLPIQSGTLGEAAIASMNAELVNVWNAHDSANPSAPPLIRCDFHTAIGGVYDGDNYKDAVHPNEIGYRLLGAELVEKAGAYFASIG